MRLAYKLLIVLSGCWAWPAIAETHTEASAVSGEALASSPDREWADTFGPIMDGISKARSEAELSAALDGIKGNAEVLGVESIELLFGMAERRGEQLDPLSDVVIADNADGLAKVASERIQRTGSAQDAATAGMQAQALYLGRIEAWCAASDGCRVEDRRRFALDLSEQMLAQSTFWLGDDSP